MTIPPCRKFCGSKVPTGADRSNLKSRRRKIAAYVQDPPEWMLYLFKAGKLRSMIEVAGYPSVAADLDDGLIGFLICGLEALALEMQPRLAG